jgi:hypothetical protein
LSDLLKAYHILFLSSSNGYKQNASIPSWERSLAETKKTLQRAVVTGYPAASPLLKIYKKIAAQFLGLLDEAIVLHAETTKRLIERRERRYQEKLRRRRANLTQNELVELGKANVNKLSEEGKGANNRGKPLKPTLKRTSRVNNLKDLKL